MPRGGKSEDQWFNLAILGILGAVLLTGAVLVLYSKAGLGKAVAKESPRVEVPVQVAVPVAAPEGVLCKSAGSCRRHAGSRKDRSGALGRKGESVYSNVVMGWTGVAITASMACNAGSDWVLSRII